MKRVDAPPVKRAVPAPPGDNQLKERLADRTYYSRNKEMLYKALCAKGDPSPRMVQCGKGPQNAVCRNVAAGLEAFRACGRYGRLVRGWKLLVVNFPGTVGHGSWRAVPHAVVHDVEKNVFHCFTSESAGKEYLFLPSSRMCTELSDSEFLSGGRVLRSVVGGNPHYVQVAESAFPEQVRRSPEAAVSYHTERTHLPHGVMMWIEEKCPGVDCVEVAKELGFPTCPSNELSVLPQCALTHDCVNLLNQAAEQDRSKDEIMDALTPLLEPRLKQTKRGRCLWELRANAKESATS